MLFSGAFELVDFILKYKLDCEALQIEVFFLILATFEVQN